MYPRIVRFDHEESDGEILLATFECYATAGEDGTEEPYFPVFRSSDGGRTWSEFSGPYVTWAPDGRGGTVLLASAKTLRDRDGGRALESGRAVLVTGSLDGTGDWSRIPAPLWFEDELETGDPSVGWTSPLVASRDEPVFAEATSAYGTDGTLGIRYARNRIERDFDR